MEQLAFFQDFFRGGGGIYCHANFVIVFGQTYRRTKVFQGCKLLQGVSPVEEGPSLSQKYISVLVEGFKLFEVQIVT